MATKNKTDDVQKGQSAAKHQMLKTQLRTDALPTEKSSKKIETELKRLSVFARKTGYFLVIDYFSTIRDTKAVDALASEKVINFAKGIGPDAAKEYFYAIAIIQNQLMRSQAKRS